MKICTSQASEAWSICYSSYISGFAEGLKGCFAKKHEKNDQWALRAFEDWIEERNASSSVDRCPQDILKTNDAVLLAKWLLLFVI